MNMSTQTLPGYLRRFCTEQDYDRYTAREHATWRYIMRQAQAFFAEHAIPAYLEGLTKTGVPIENIPRVNEIDACLRDYGWGAIGVTGFIPPAAFLDFQSRGIMPIAMDMRTLEHVAYTPAPDIVHEAAGHVPILVDADYRQYLKLYAAMARKAIISRDDVILYEAIRYLSDIKENPDTKPGEIAKAEAQLSAATAAVQEVTELAQVARMNWWTAEYGLVGSLKSPKIYGAGLLSSVGESKQCLTDKVRKIPLSVRCIDQSYDITEPQPQLFVAESMQQLPEVLNQLADTMAFKVGGASSLAKAKRAANVISAELSSGLVISGLLSEFFAEGTRVDFLKFAGPCQLATDESQMNGHGPEHHGLGFSSPLGRWQALASTPPETLQDSDLERLGIRAGQQASLVFSSGFVVSGVVQRWQRQQGKLVLLTWTQCTVRRGEQIFFQPSWGDFDMAVGDRVTSVFGGPADREKFGMHDLGKVSSAPGRQSPFSTSEKELLSLYAETRALRTREKIAPQDLQRVADKALQPGHKNDWLLALEVAELARKHRLLAPDLPWLKAIDDHLTATKNHSDAVTSELVERGLALVGK